MDVAGRIRCAGRDRAHGGARGWVPLVAALLLLAFARPGESAPSRPAPSYDNTLYGFVYALNLGSQAGRDLAERDLLARATPGPYARVGLSDYFRVDMPWRFDPANPVLTWPSPAFLDELVADMKRKGLPFHASVLLGVSRASDMYDKAKNADRRNAQWYQDGLIDDPGVGPRKALSAAWITPSRYARKLRAHLEAKVRAWAKMFLQLDARYPDTLISTSGDGESELNDGRLDTALAYDDQIIADYSPFTVLEFRDWLLHTGLYAPGGPYAGEGYVKKQGRRFEQGGPAALTPENLVKFNKAFKSSFTTWDLEYFHWSLDDPIDGDPGAIPFKLYKKPTWSPNPTGPGLHRGGFDAPRSKNDMPRLWKAWQSFRRHLVANFARDVAGWITGTPGTGGRTIAPDRWYSHQIPGDYLNGTYPGDSRPDRRLQTSASPMWTAIVGDDVGSPGLTILDRREPGAGGAPVYNRTSEHSLDAIEALNLPNWGVPEYSPSWFIDTAPDTDTLGLKAQYHRMYGAGAHMFSSTPWPHFVLTDHGWAFGQFIAEVNQGPHVASYGMTREAYVRQLYLDLAGQQPSSGELAAGLAAIAAGTGPRQKLYLDLADSLGQQRALGLLTRLYLGLLKKRPTPAEISNWRSSLTAQDCRVNVCTDAILLQIVDAVLGSPSFQSANGGAAATMPIAQFITVVWQGLLGQTPGLDVIQAFQFAPRNQIVLTVGKTDNSIAHLRRDATVVLAFANLLRDPNKPSNAEFNDWTGFLGNSPSLGKRMGLAQFFITSPEYLGRLGS
ncbi:MAG: hypothetical protein FJ148_19805 [Deltaproteobacteria bacterium]|nr:hypothetical protein [Deltaproteobacteria bacterium]